MRIFETMMKLLFKAIIIISLLLSFSVFGQQFEKKNMAGMQWAKGILHTHAREGESDSSVDDVIRWYKDHGYQFVVITDHNVISYPKDESLKSSSDFCLSSGEEITGFGGPIDFEINGFNIKEAIQPLHGQDVPAVLQACIDSVRRQGGVPMINHPNYQWRLNGETILNTKNCYLFEMHNAFPGVNNEGDANHPDLETVWDFMLTNGKHIYGVATDDAHSYFEFSPDLSNPGRGCVVVQTPSLKTEDILKNLEAGLFYSSTGVEVEAVLVEPKRMTITIMEKEDVLYSTEFIGSNGEILATTKDNPAIYNLTNETCYVRARVNSSKGDYAWTQPVFVE